MVTLENNKIDDVTHAFNRLLLINAELENLENIFNKCQNEKITKIFSIELQTPKEEPPAKNLFTGGDEDMQPVIIMERMGGVGGGFPFDMGKLIADQTSKKKRYENERFDYQLSESLTIEVITVIANNYKKERAETIEYLKTLGIEINQ